MPVEFLLPSKLRQISETALKIVQKSNPDYTLAINGVLPYYDMKLVTVATDTEGQLVVSFPIFVQNFNKVPLKLYKIETVKVPIEDQN